MRSDQVRLHDLKKFPEEDSSGNFFLVCVFFYIISTESSRICSGLFLFKCIELHTVDPVRSSGVSDWYFQNRSFLVFCAELFSQISHHAENWFLCNEYQQIFIQITNCIIIIFRRFSNIFQISSCRFNRSCTGFYCKRPQIEWSLVRIMDAEWACKSGRPWNH